MVVYRSSVGCAVVIKDTKQAVFLSNLEREIEKKEKFNGFQLSTFGNPANRNFPSPIWPVFRVPSGQL